MARIILVVDDTGSCGDTLAVALVSMHGLEVRTVSSADRAWEILEDGTDVAALITDLHMPVVDGFELIARVRSQLRFRALPILVVSGDGDAATPARVNALGANAFFLKPFSPSEVRGRLEKLLYAA